MASMTSARGVNVRVAGARRSRAATVVRAQGDQQQVRPSVRRVIIGAGVAAAAALVSVPMIREARAGIFSSTEAKPQGEVRHTEEEWKALLSPESYRVLRESGTERSFTSPLYKEKRVGTYLCAGCDSPLYTSESKYDSGTGWPSFYDVIPGAIDTDMDTSIMFMPRVEVRCHKCQGHLGHVFDDGPAPTGKRYCMNGVALKFQPSSA